MALGSPNNTTIPPATQIVDNLGRVWTMPVIPGWVFLDGVQQEAFGVQLLWFNTGIYMRDTAGNWWINEPDPYGFPWTQIGADPRAQAPSAQQASGTTAQSSLGVAWDPSPESNVTGYLISYGTQSGAPVSSIDVGSHTSGTVNGLSTNTVYYFSVRAYSADGLMSAPSQEVSGLVPAPASTPPPPPSAISSVTLTPNKTAPQMLGTTVGWTAGSTGGAAPYSYRWWLSANGSTTPLTSWTSNNNYTWTPTVANNTYQVTACARSAWNTLDSPEACLTVPFAITQPATVNLTASVPSPQVVRSTIVWTATPSGGTAPYQYRWWLSTGSTSVPLTGWSYSSSFSWTPTTADRNYVMTVWVRSAGNSVDAPEMSRSVAFPIVPPRCKWGKKC